MCDGKGWLSDNKSKIKSITLFKFSYTPWEKGPIRSMDVFIAAETRKDAELIALSNNHKFFDQSTTVEVSEILKGYKQGG